MVPLLGSVQRQVVCKLGHQHLGQQAGGGDALIDNMRIHRGLNQGLALGASPFASDMTLYAEDAGHVVEFLGHVFTDAL